tara:strand:- start:421 stop:981 length:561 start_codon:yes stop_codon:yes gene_type:complete
MTKEFNKFIENNIQDMHILKVCEEYVERLQGAWEIMKEVYDSDPVLKKVEKAYNEEIAACEALKSEMVLFWDYKDGCPFAAESYLDEEYLYLFGSHGNLPSELINPNLGDKVYVTEGYLYKEVVSSYSPFTSINWEKTTYRVKVSDLPSVNEEAYKEHGYRVRADLGLVQIPEWEEVSTQQMGHEY